MHGGTALCADCWARQQQERPGRPPCNSSVRRDWRRIARTAAVAGASAVAVLGLTFVIRGAWLTSGTTGDAYRLAEQVRDNAELREAREQARDAVANAAAQAAAGDFPRIAERVMASVVLVSTGGFLEARGTGFAVSNEGHILTAAHVVDDTDRPEVALPSGSRLRGDVLWRDEGTDVALLNVPGANLPALPLGDSDQTRVGTEVAVAGFPLNISMEDMGFQALTPTLVQGIVAARQSQQITPLSRPVSVLQIDANLNPGHSGGPVFLRSNGTVVGIANAAIVEMSGGKTDICFAVPINDARRLMQ